MTSPYANPRDAFSAEQQQASGFQWQQQPGAELAQMHQPYTPLPAPDSPAQQRGNSLERDRERSSQTKRLAICLAMAIPLTGMAGMFEGNFIRLIAMSIIWMSIAQVAWIFSGRKAPWSKNPTN